MRIFEEIPISDLSREWLLDEHRTLHALWKLFDLRLQKNPNFTWNGYTKNDIKKRHLLIVEEMVRRGYNHNYKSDIDENCYITQK